MRFSAATLLAVLMTVYAAPAPATGNALMDGVEGSVTNSRQVMDTLTRQLQSGDGHPTADMLSAFITGADSQIDNAAAAISEALAPVTGGLSEVVGNFLLGPFVQSLTNGAEVLLSNLVAAPIDAAVGPMVSSFAKSLSNVSTMAKNNKVDTAKLDSAIAKLNSQTHKHKRATGNALMDGVEGSVTNSRQVMDTLTRQLQSGDGHPTADMISAFITGADSQIDNAAAAISEALAPVTGGLSEVVGNFLLGPFVQSLTNGAEVLLSNLIAAPIDAAIGPMVSSFAKSLSNVSTLAKNNKVDTTKLDSAIVKLSAHSHKGKRATGNALMDGVQGSVTNSRQVMDTLTRQLQSGDGHPTADMISAFITGADSQIDNAAAAISEALAPVTGGLSEVVGNFLLGPFVQSLTNGAEVLLSNLIAAPIDAAIGPMVSSFAKSLSNVSSLAKNNKVDTTKLDSVIVKLNSHTSHKHKRASGNALMDGVQGSVTNSRQVMDTLTRQLQSGDGHPTADMISAFITGADSQIDNAAAAISEALAPVTGGLSEVVGGFLLGPFVQSLTNGAEVLLSNLVAAPIDAAVGPLVSSFAKSLSNVSTLAKNNKVDTSKLDATTAKLTALVKKH